MSGRLAKFIKNVIGVLGDPLVADCPPEFYACEVCRRLECDDAEWRSCERRLNSERYVRAMDEADNDGHCRFYQIAKTNQDESV